MENLLISACLLGIPCRYDGESKALIEKKTLDELKWKYNLIPVCPEIYGGLPTPRTGSERVGDSVYMNDGTNVTENFRRGAEVTLKFAELFGCRCALLKEKSPSCGTTLIHDGTFTGTLRTGEGVAAELLRKNGILLFSEEKIEELL